MLWRKKTKLHHLLARLEHPVGGYRCIDAMVPDQNRDLRIPWQG